MTSPDPTAAQRAKNLALFFIKLSVAVGLLVYVAKNKVDEKGLAELRKLFQSPLILCAAIGAFSVQLVIGAQRLRILLAPQQVFITYFTALRLTYLGAFFDTFMVTSVGGDAIKAIYLARVVPRDRRVEAVSVLVLDRLMGLIGLLALTLGVAALQYQKLSASAEASWVLKWLLIVPAVLLICTAMLLSETVYACGPMQTMLRILPFGATLSRAYGSLQKFRDRPTVLLKALGMSLIVHFFGVLTGYILMLGMNGNAEMGPFFVALLICNFACSFAPFAGIGVGQAIYTPMFKMIAGIDNGWVLATVMQAAILIAKAPGFVAWLLSREAPGHPPVEASAAEPGSVAAPSAPTADDLKLKEESRYPMLNTELLKILACPWCVTRPETGKNVLAKGELELQGKPDAPTGLKCKQCGRIYGILENGIPNLLIEDAKQAPVG